MKLKNIRNNWLTESIKELAFYARGMKEIARWSHLLELYKLEAECLVKMPKLTELSVYPKHIGRQSAATCLWVFCQESYTTVINHPVMRNVDGCEHIAEFIKIVVNWWNRLNVTRKGKDVRFNNTFNPHNKRFREFGNLHQISGTTYFMTVQQFKEKPNISKTSPLLPSNVNDDSFNIGSDHLCFNCNFLLVENSAEIFDSFPD